MACAAGSRIARPTDAGSGKAAILESANGSAKNSQNKGKSTSATWPGALRTLTFRPLIAPRRRTARATESSGRP